MISITAPISILQSTISAPIIQNISTINAPIQVGIRGDSAYQAWLNAGNSGTLQDFVASLKGDDGKSAYQVWLDLGHTGTEQDFLESLVISANGIEIGDNSHNVMTNVLHFNNSNNVSFGYTNGTLTASVNVGNQSSLVFQGSNNVHFGINGSTLTASVDTIAQSAYVFSNSNNVSFGTNGSTVTASASYPNQSIQTQNSVLVLNSSGNVSFGNANGVTFGGNNGTITASVLPFNQTVQTQNVVQILGSSGNISFSNSNGITFGADGSTITASHNGLTTQSGQAVSASGGSSTFQTLVFANSNGVTFSNSNGSIIASYTVPTIPGATVFNNGNNVTFGLNGSTMTASVSFIQSQQPVYFSASGTNTSGNTLQFGNSNGVSFSLSNGSLIATVKTDYQSSNANYITSQSIQTQNSVQILGSSGNVSFANSNGITFGANASTITASHNGLTTAAQSNHSHGNPTLALTNLTGTTASNSNGFTLSLSAAPGGLGADGFNILGVNGAGTQSATTLQLSNSNNVSFGLNAGTITASASYPSQTIQTQNVHNLTFSGNTAGVMAQVSSGVLTIAGGNNITISQNGNAITLSGANIGGAQTGISGISVSNSVLTSGTLIFSNSNGVGFGLNGNTLTISYTVPTIPGATLFSNSNNVTFGLNGSTVTASASYPVQTVQPVAISGSNGSFAYSTLTLGNSNGLSFYSTNGSIVGSYTVPTVLAATVFSNSNNITFGLNGSTITASATFAQTVQTQNSIQVQGSSGNVVFSNSNGVTFGFNANTITASHNGLTSQSNQAISVGNGSFTFQTLTLADSNGISFSTGAQGVYATVKTDYWTTGALSNHSHGNPTLALTNLTGTTASNSNGFTLSLSAGVIVGDGYNIIGVNGAGTQSLTTLQLSNFNNVSFGLNAGTITASASYPAQTNQPVAISGSNGSFNFSTVTLGNSNGVSFYTTNGSIVASYTVPTIPGATSFSNLNNVTFGLAGSTITASASYPVQTVQPVAISGSNGSFNFSTVTFGASNGVSFYTTNGSIVASYTVPSATVFSNSNNVTFGLNGSTITASATFNQTVQTQNSIQVLGSSGNISFGNANGISFGANGSTITATYTVPNVPAQTVQTQNLHNVTLSGNTAGVMAQISSGTLTFAGGNNITLSQNGNAITISGPNIGGAQTGISVISVGANLLTAGTLVFSNSNGVGFGLNGSTLTASYTVPTIPGATSFSNLNNVTFGLAGSTITASASYPAQTVQPVAISGSNGSFAFSTVTLGNSNGVSFYTTNGSIVASYTVPTQTIQTQNSIQILGSSGNISFANGNNVTFGVNASTITASASFNQTVQPVAISGSNGSFAFSTVTFGASNGVSFYTTNGSIVANYTVPAATVFSNSNNVSFGLNGSTITASASFNQTQQPVYFSASGTNTSGNTLQFGNSNGVSFSLSNGSLIATVKTDYQSSNANYITSQSVQTQNLQNVTFSGNTAGVMANVSSGALTFAGGNNITLSQNGNAVTISGPNIGGAQTGISAIWVGAQSLTAGTLVISASNGLAFGLNGSTLTGSYTVPAATVFSNSNNVTFGLNGSTVTATATFPAQTNQPVAISGSNGSFNFSTLTLGNSNGVSFYSTNGSIVASYTVPSIPAATVFSNSNNVTFGLNGSTVTASASYQAQTAQPVAVSGTNGSYAFSTLSYTNLNGASFYTTTGAGATAIALSYTVPSATQFSNSNNVSFGLNGSTITASATFNQTVQTQNSVQILGSSGNISFGNANGLSFGVNGSTITATYTVPNVPAQTVQPVAVSGSNGSFAYSTLTLGASNGLSFYSTNGSIVASYTVPTIPGATVFSNSNNVTFGLNGSTITASVSYAAQTVQPVAISGSNGSFAYSTVTFGASNGASFYTTNGSVVVSYTVPAAQTIQTQNSIQILGSSGNISFANGNNVTFGGNASTVTASASFNQTIQTQNSIQILGSSGNISFANGNNITFGVNASTITASASFVAQTVQPVAASGSNGSFAFSTLTFGNSNGLTHYTTNGSIVASYTVPTIPGATVFSNSNNVTFGLNGSTITASATFPVQTVQPVAISGSNGSFTFSTVTFGASNGATFYTTNGSVVVSYTVPAAQTIQTQNSVRILDSTGNISFANGNNITFGVNASTITASASFVAQTVQPVAASGSNGSFAFSTLTFGNSNGLTHYTTNGSIVASYTVPGITAFSNSNNVSFGLNGSTITATATFPTQTVQPVAVSGSNGSFAFSTVTFGNSNAFSFYTTNGSIVGSYTVPVIPNATVFSNSNNVTFGLNGSTVTASATFAQTNQTVGMYAYGNTTQSSTGTVDARSLSFAGSGNVSVGITGNTIVISATGGGGADGYNILGVNGAGTALSTTLQLSNSNNVSFGLNLGTITASASFNQTIQTQNSVQVLGSSGNISFANGNNITFGANANTITASASYPAQTVQPVAVSGSNGSFNFSTLTFGQSNGATFYTTNNSMVVSYTVPTIPGATVFSNSNNVSFGLNGSTVTATATFNQTVQTQNSVQILGSSGNISFSNLNGISFGVNGSTITASYSSNHSHGNPTLNLTNINGTTASASNGLTLSLSAVIPAQTVQPVAISGSNGSFAFSTLTLGNSNAFSFYTTNGSIVGSYTVPSIPGATVFSNSNNVSFGLNGSTVTATATFAQTVQTIGMYAYGNTTQSSTGTVDARSLSFYGAGVASVGVTGNSVVISVPTGGGAGDGYNILGVNGAGTSLSATLQLSNSNNVSFGLNAGTITASASYPSQTVQPVAVSGTNGSFAFSTLTFGQSNNFSFYTTNGSIVLGGGDFVVGAVGSTNTITNLIFSNSNNLTFGLNGNTITGSASFAQSVQPVAVSGSNGSFAFSTVTFGNLNGLSFYTSNGSIVGSYTVGGGAAQSVSSYIPMYPASTVSQTLGVMGATTGSAIYFPMLIQENVKFNCINMLMNMSFATSTIAASQSLTLIYGLYTENNSTLSLISSSYLSFAISNSSVSGTISYASATGTNGYTYTTIGATTSAQLQSYFGTAGCKIVGLQFGNSMSVTPGQYWMGMLQKASSNGGNVGISAAFNGNALPSMVNAGPIGQYSSAVTTNFLLKDPLYGFGPYTSTASAGYGGTALPSSVFLTGIAHTMSIMPLVSFLST